MKKLLIITFSIVWSLSSCFHETHSKGENTKQEEKATVIEPQGHQFTEEEFVDLLDYIDKGSKDGIDFEQYLDADISIPVLSKWIQDKQQQNPVYYNQGITIRENNEVVGLLLVAALANKVVFFYEKNKDNEYHLCDILVVEKKLGYITTEKLTIINNLTNPLNSNLGERDKYQFGIVHFDLDKKILVYEKWFHPDEILKIDPDSGKLELIQNVSPNQYVMIEGA